MRTLLDDELEISSSNMETITAWNCCSRVSLGGLDLKRYVIVYTVHMYPLSHRFEFFHSGERFQTLLFLVDENARYPWMEPVTVKIFLRFKFFRHCVDGVKRLLLTISASASYCAWTPPRRLQTRVTMLV